MSKAADARCVDGEIELEAGKYSIVCITKAEGETSPFYLSIYFDCEKDQIQWQQEPETIWEEEEEAEGDPKSTISVGMQPNQQKTKLSPEVLQA